MTAFTGRQVRAYRQLRGLSAEQLADAVDAAGLPFTRSQVTNLEAKRRTTITVGEVLVLAKVLDVPPVLLIFPLGQDSTLEVVPGELADTWSAVKWFMGEQPISDTDDRWQQSAAAVDLYRSHDRFLVEWRVAQRAAASAHRRRMAQTLDVEMASILQETATLAERTMRIHENTLWEVRERMRQLGFLAPELPDELSHIATDKSPLGRAIENHYARKV
jgi:transcriptional regulator with XRE-family HTH domain